MTLDDVVKVEARGAVAHEVYPVIAVYVFALLAKVDPAHE